MFSYLRYFSIISFIVVVVAAVLLGVYFRSIASSDYADVAEKSSVSLAQGYINTTWKTHLPNIKRLSALDTATWGRYKEFVAFSEDTFRHFEGVPITQLNIYTSSGEKVLSVNQDAEISYTSGSSINALPETSSTRRGFAQARKGEPFSHIIEDTEFQTPAGETVRGAVVQTFVPIMPDSYSSVLAGADVQVEGVIEVFYDITPQWQQLYLFQVIGTGGILIIFVTLLGALFFTSKKAESIITTQHEANVELAATAAKAEAESRQKSQFLANVSHELRTPLNAIIGFSEIIKNEVMGALQNETYMNYIKDIHSSGVHLLSLINDILDFSKAEAGKLELHLSELDATKLIKNCMRLVSPRAEQAKVTLTTEVPKEHFIITGDAKKLKQVLLNLLSNAVKFTPEGGEVKVTAWQNVMDDSIAIEVKDSGIGIAPKDISRAMSPFGQVDSALSRKYEGTGLGLPLTKKFVEIMGGTFRIESELNVGTTITITVPLTPPRHVLRASARAHEEENDMPREKQVSPQLMQHAQQHTEDAIMRPAPSLTGQAAFTGAAADSSFPSARQAQADISGAGNAMPQLMPQSTPFEQAALHSTDAHDSLAASPFPPVDAASTATAPQSHFTDSHGFSLHRAPSLTDGKMPVDEPVSAQPRAADTPSAPMFGQTFAPFSATPPSSPDSSPDITGGDTPTDIYGAAAPMPEIPPSVEPAHATFGQPEAPLAHTHSDTPISQAPHAFGSVADSLPPLTGDDGNNTPPSKSDPFAITPAAEAAAANAFAAFGETTPDVDTSQQAVADTATPSSPLTGAEPWTAQMPEPAPATQPSPPLDLYAEKNPHTAAEGSALPPASSSTAETDLADSPFPPPDEEHPAPAPTPSDGGGQKFMSYADLKRLAQQQQGSGEE